MFSGVLSCSLTEQNSSHIDHSYKISLQCEFSCVFLVNVILRNSSRSQSSSMVSLLWVSADVWGVLMWRDSSLPLQHHEVVEAPQRIHDSHVSLLCEQQSDRWLKAQQQKSTVKRWCQQRSHYVVQTMTSLMNVNYLTIVLSQVNNNSHILSRFHISSDIDDCMLEIRFLSCWNPKQCARQLLVSNIGTFL